MLTGLLIVLACSQVIALVFVIALCRAGDDSVHARIAAKRDERPRHDSSPGLRRLAPRDEHA
jgi:hypothetical protein